MARIASFLVGRMKWLEEKALALLPFALAAAKNAGAPKRLSASQKVYTKKPQPTFGCSKYHLERLV